MRRKPKLVVAGASGFIGTAVCAALAEDYDVTALTRSRARVHRASDARITWRRCDLFSPREVEEALEGFEYAIYLVNNMVPSARLSQSRCSDMDVLVADNFGRAASLAGLRQIVCLGLLLPQGDIPEGKEEDETTLADATRRQVIEWRKQASRGYAGQRFRRDVRGAYDYRCFFSGDRLPKIKDVSSGSHTTHR